MDLRKVSDTPNDSAEDVVSQFTGKVAHRIYWGAVLVTLPLAFIQAVEHQWLMLAWLCAFICYTSVTAVRVKRLSRRRGRHLIFVTLLCAAVMYSTLVNGIHGLLWAYPVMASIAFLLSWRLAIIVTVTFVSVLALVSLYTIEPDVAWRSLVSLLVIMILTLTLVRLLTRMQWHFTELATTDTLTGVYNRKQLQTDLEQLVALKARHGRAVSAALCDIDYFKDVNDRYGHFDGDRLLIQAAQLIKSSFRASDKVFRVGGEEFVVLMSDTSLEGATKAAEKLREAFAANDFELKQEPVNMTISIGVSELGSDESWLEWLERADKLLYHAKDMGRNQVRNTVQEIA